MPDPNVFAEATWRTELPTLVGRAVTLREPASQDLAPLVDLLAPGGTTRFGLEEPVTDSSVLQLIARVARDRANGMSVTYAITLTVTGALVGLLQMRSLDPAFEAGECECTIEPSTRGSGVFIDAARLAGSFAFTTLCAHRLEARVLLENGRANGALRKLGAVQEGILRRSVRRGGDYADQVLWSLLKEDWREHSVSIAGRVH
jgi:RimJ/RimL family protein N-acetyltransferase